MPRPLPPAGAPWWKSATCGSNPDRIVPRNARAAAMLKSRTLTKLYKLYNTRGTPAGVWLENLHHALDEAVAAAYGWPADLSDDEVLSRLLALNLERSAGQVQSA
jgi:hypothetical protein